MLRRTLIGGTLLLPVALTAPNFWRPDTVQAADAPDAAFSAATVRDIARDLAGKPYVATVAKLPDALAHLTYDQYRSIRFNPARALWHGQGLPFEVQFFHRGFFYADRVEIFQVVNGRAELVHYNSDLFDMGQVPQLRAAPGVTPADDIGFAGFRLHAPMNRPDYYDEVCVFLGASYFRAVAKGQGYGLSARGLAIKTANPGGEEFPAFRRFWLERPQQHTDAMVIHALLDSPSASGAFRFTIRPGNETIFDIETTIYPRVDVDQVGIATLTSMFDFDENDRVGVDDYRRAVHDSNGLQMWTGRGERLWRPLANPSTLQLSSFMDPSPRGFGLLQRKRNFFDYDDLEARYEKRPSLWIEPIGDIGAGAVHLVEIPTKREIDDNIVAFWRPKDILKAKGEYTFTYRQHWCWDAPWPSDVAKVTKTAGGASGTGETRLFVLEVAGGKLEDLPADARIQADVTASQGKILNVVSQPNPETKGWRLSFELAPDGAKLVELRAILLEDKTPVSEAWLYRWTA